MPGVFAVASGAYPTSWHMPALVLIFGDVRAQFVVRYPRPPPGVPPAWRRRQTGWHSKACGQGPQRGREIEKESKRPPDGSRQAHSPRARQSALETWKEISSNSTRPTNSTSIDVFPSPPPNQGPHALP